MTYYRKNISIDFDGVIHAHTSAWTTATEIHDGPVPGAFDFIRQALNGGYGVQILSARANDPGVEQAIVQWFLKHGLEFFYIDQLNISPIKKGAVIYIDDNGWRFDGTWPSLETIAGLRRWDAVASTLPAPPGPPASQKDEEPAISPELAAALYPDGNGAVEQ